MKLIRMISRWYKEIPYYKFRINLPSSIISQLRWNGGEELNCTVKKIGKVRGLFITKIKSDESPMS